MSFINDLKQWINTQKYVKFTCVLNILVESCKCSGVLQKLGILIGRVAVRVDKHKGFGGTRPDSARNDSLPAVLTTSSGEREESIPTRGSASRGTKQRRSYRRRRRKRMDQNIVLQLHRLCFPAATSVRKLSGLNCSKFNQPIFLDNCTSFSTKL